MRRRSDVSVSVSTSLIHIIWMALLVVLSRFATPTEAFDLSVASNTASTAWAWYLSSLKTNPLLTKSVTSSGIMTVSDVLCQKLIQTASNSNNPSTTKTSKTTRQLQQNQKQVAAMESNQKSKDNNNNNNSLDVTRIVQVAITGFFWSGPSTHTWYSVLERIVTVKDPVVGLISRIVLDALIYSPMTVSGYFVVRSILEGSGWIGAKQKLQTKLWSTVKGAWKFWPLANIINFGFVPLELRVLYVNVLSLFWTGYLSYVNAKKVVVVETATTIPAVSGGDDGSSGKKNKAA